MAVLRRLDQLAKQSEKLGLTVIQTGKRPKKDDYIQALRAHFLKIDYPDGNLPDHLKYMLSLKSPMLCERLTEFDAQAQENIWNSALYVAEKKYNGCRMIMIYSVEEGFHFYSRNISVKNFRAVEYKNIWLGRKMLNASPIPGIKNFVLDCEIMSPTARVSTLKSTMSNKGCVTETELQAVAALLALNAEESLTIQESQNILLEFHTFHVLYFNDKDYMQIPWNLMRRQLESFVDRLNKNGLNVWATEVVYVNKKKFFEEIIAAGGEGAILKHVEAHYFPTESRSHRAWIKAKRTVQDTIIDLGLGDTVDAFVVGWEKGSDDTANEKLVGSLDLAVNLKRLDGTVSEHVIARVANFTLEERKNMTRLDENGNVFLKLTYLYKVAEVDGQVISARERRITHPRFLRWREDKSPEQCNFDESVLNKLIM